VRHTRLINYALYQMGWFACVLSAASHRPWTGFLIAMMLVGVHLTLSVERSVEVRLVMLAATAGAVLEMVQIAAGTYRVTSETVTQALPPLWLLAMWGQLATTFRHSMRPVITRPIRAAVLGAAGGPLAFVAGEWLGAVTLLPPLGCSLLRISVSWAIAMLLFSAVVRRGTLERGGRTPREAS